MLISANATGDFGQWDASDYLREYYSRVEADEQLTLEFLIQECRKLPRGGTAIDFGSGPTVHNLIALSPYVEHVDIADFVPQNLAQIRAWLNHEPGAHDWQSFTRHVLACEGFAGASVETRESLLRGRIENLLRCDASRPSPIEGGCRRYNVVLTCYCADSATCDKSTWHMYLQNILSLLKTGGTLLLAALRKCRGYSVGSCYFPSANIDESDVRDMFEHGGIEMERARIAVGSVLAREGRGYDSIILASGQTSQIKCSASAQNKLLH